MHNRGRSKNYDVSKKEKAEDKPNVQPVANIRDWFSVLPLCVFYTEQENIQRNRECKKSQAKTYLAYLLNSHELLFLLQQTFCFSDFIFCEFLGVKLYNLLLQSVDFCRSVVKSCSNLFRSTQELSIENVMALNEVVFGHFLKSPFASNYVYSCKGVEPL